MTPDPGGRDRREGARTQGGHNGAGTGASLDEAVRAMGHPGRRAMLRLAGDGEHTAAELAATAGLSAPAASQHLKVLRDTGLLEVRVDAQRRLYRANFARLAEVRAVLDELWTDRLVALKAHAETADGDSSGAAAEGTSGRRSGRSA